METTGTLFAPPAPRTRLWAVGGGKGGVGKTVITSSLAITLARTGRRTVVVDVDLGGANLHTLLGIPHPKKSLSQFLARETDDLREVLVPTPIPNLWMISGAHALLDMANPKAALKDKLIRRLASLEMEHVLLDLGAGTTFNTLDFFLAAEEGVLVVIPEPTSIENAYHFIKSAFYRKLKRATRQEGVTATIEKVMSEKIWRGIRSPRELIEAVREENPEAGRALMAEAAAFRPRLIVNQVRRFDERELGREICAACAVYFGIEMSFLGSLEREEKVVEAVRLKRAPLELHPATAFARALQGMASTLLKEGGGAPAPGPEEADGEAEDAPEEQREGTDGG